MEASHRGKLFLMMVLELFIWGAWFPLVFGYLPSIGFSNWQQTLVLNAFPFAAIVGMFFSNQFADRTFAAERFLSFSHIVGGLAMIGLAFSQGIWHWLKDVIPSLGQIELPWLGVAPGDPNAFLVFFALMLLHCLLYVPTISITNSIAFTHMKDPQKEFGLVRMGGTLGWIMAAWPFTFILVDWARVEEAKPEGVVNWLGTVLSSGLQGDALREGTRWTFVVAGIASLVLAGYSLTLPHTPPKPAAPGTGSLAWVGALRLLRHPFVLVLWLVTFLDSFVHNCFFSWAGRFLGSPEVGIPGNWIMPVMSIGQVAEILTMLILGVTLKALGWRATMVFGILGHAARFAVFAFYPEMTKLVVLVNVLHGICYAFFFATVYIFVDEHFPKDMRASAQGLFNVMILGIGAIAANVTCPWLFSLFTDAAGNTDYKHLFYVPLISAVTAALALALCFHPPRKEAPQVAGAPATDH